MQILFDPGTYNCLNLGDVAMLQVAVLRLRRMVPGAKLTVISDAPEALKRHCPGCETVRADARRIWFDDSVVLGRGQRFMPPPILKVLSHSKRWIRRNHPKALMKFLGLTVNLSASGVHALTRAVYSADCLVVCGQGFLTDHAREHALVTLNLMAAAQERKIPCFTLGQGIGPLTDESILALSRKVLPRIDLLSLRESRAGIPLCRQIGISSERCLITGDEAIELAFRECNRHRLNGFGVNVRIAPSAGLNENILLAVALALRQFSTRYKFDFVPLPIARGGRGLHDVQAIQRLLALAGHDSDGGATLNAAEAVIEAAARCRIVLTGAYHAAVFALSQGVPAICIAKSDYFRVKFEGLADQFGEGCVVVSADQPRLIEHLVERLSWAWEAAPRLQSSLRKAALLQILKSYRAYNRAGRILQRRYPKAEIHYLASPLAPIRERVKAAGLCHE